MSSIGSTINSINSSLLSEIYRYNASRKQNSPPVNTPVSTTQSDAIDFSKVGQLFSDLKQLRTSDPAEFKQVLTDAASQLKAAASQTADPQQAGFLNNLAEKFQTAASTGNLDALQQSPSQSAAGGLYAPSHHHHRHGGGGGTTQIQDQTSSPLSGVLLAP